MCITKAILVCAISLYCCANAFAQQNRLNKKDSTRILDVKYFKYSLLSNDASAFNSMLPLSKITCYDMRYDTSFIALNWQTNTNTVFSPKEWNKKYTLNEGVSNNLTSYLKHFYTKSFGENDGELLCYIKRMSFTTADTLLYFHNPHEVISHVNFEVEAYYKKDSLYYPAFKIDTAYTLAIYKIKRDFDEVVKDMISPLKSRIQTLDIIKILKRKTYSLQQLQQKYQDRFNLPVLQNDAKQRGIYKTFEEFKNNTPYITNFRIEEKKRGIFLYDADNELVNTLHIFGFCDGENYWIQKGALCYPLVRVGNAYEFMYLLTVTDANGARSIYHILLSLNMDTGKVE